MDRQSRHCGSSNPTRSSTSISRCSACYAALGLVIIWVTEKPGFVFKLATTGYNFAFAFSAWHTLVVNTLLLPKELRPGWPQRVGLILAGVFFLTLGIVSALKLAKVIT